VSGALAFDWLFPIFPSVMLFAWSDWTIRVPLFQCLRFILDWCFCVLSWFCLLLLAGVWGRFDRWYPSLGCSFFSAAVYFVTQKSSCFSDSAWSALDNFCCLQTTLGRTRRHPVAHPSTPSGSTTTLRILPVSNL
jgi:hypothetical protein